MAVLPDSDRQALWAQFMGELSSERARIALAKSDLRAAVDSIDAWVDANAPSFNQAIPQPARSGLTPRQKARLLLYVVRRRFEVG
jgi:hypothetical protein